MIQMHPSLAGKQLSKFYYATMRDRLVAEHKHLYGRLIGSCDTRRFKRIPDKMEDLCQQVSEMRRLVVATARRRGQQGTEKSHYWAWLYTPEERREQNLMCGYNCTLPMDVYKQLNAAHGGRVA